jgi:hypothetical protein
MVAAVWASARPAWACSCVNGLEAVAPHPGAVDRPSNTLVRLWYRGDDFASHQLFEDGVERDVVQNVEQHGETFLITLTAADPLTPGAFYEVFRPDSSSSLTHFTIGADADSTPPVWDGRYTVDNRRKTVVFNSCGPFRFHEFEWVGLEDDAWADDELLVLGDPDVEGGESFARAGTTAEIGESVCSHDDATLIGDFHRTYELFVEDGSGNRIGPFEVDTRACGCTSAAPLSGWSPVALVAAGLGWRRRRRPVRRSVRSGAPPYEPVR